MTTFTINAKPGTDIWRKPPHTDIFNAPTAGPASAGLKNTPARGPLSTFRSARISFSFPWKEQYDQAGLLLSIYPKNPKPSNSPGPEKWIKTGVEYYNSKPMLSTVSCDNWADWSVSPLTTSSPSSAGEDKIWTTISIEKEHDKHGSSLWVYQILEGGEEVALREICWVYGSSTAPVEEWEVEVLAMACRPSTKDSSGRDLLQAEEELVAEFRDFDLQWSK
ncbi:hypothetical protein QBC46DRAFT_453379 [Diplogelasinospora grovesii]|uniref:Uncharacterized protein n=1 Tax=Diplogelasinospora grovesii TaxID=303347 RepID=A0AAN6S050_9PEZI|nr:hypothetical protein QBC46DRAFT_453379 [Diplogelasinospora grovesii]